MARFGTHATVGVLVSGGIAVYDSHREKGEIDFEILLAGSAGGFLGGILPDLLDPASDPNHRKFFHAILPTAITLMKSDFAGIEDPRARAFLKGLLWSYVSHLIVDLGSPKGLPLVC